MSDKPKYSHLGNLKKALAEVCELFEFGAIKYPNRKWDVHWSNDEAKTFIKMRLESLMRHTMDVMKTYDSFDSESQVHNLAAVAWNALVILELHHRIEEDTYSVLDDWIPSPNDSILFDRYSDVNIDGVLTELQQSRQKYSAVLPKNEGKDIDK